MFLRRVFAGLCILIALVPMMVAAVCLANPHRPLLYLIDIFTLPALSLSAVMSVGFWALRQRIASGACLAATVALLVALMPQAFPAQPAARPGAPHLRVVFANLYIYNPHQTRILRFIAAQNPDIVAAVEAAPGLNQTLFPSLGALYPYHYTIAETALFSRFPIDNVWHSPFPRSLLSADVASTAGNVHINIVHFAEPIPLHNNFQAEQTTFLEQHAGAPGRRDMLIVGDFNSDFSASRLQGMARNLGLHALGAPSGSWPTVLPSFFRIAIDNAMAGPGWRLTRRTVSGPFGSDHRAIAFDMTPAA